MKPTSPLQPHSTRTEKLSTLRSGRGFSLVEVMIAFSIMILVLCGGLGTLIAGARAIDTARCSTLAAQIMQSRIERLRLMSWTAIQQETNQTFSPTDLQSLVPSAAASTISRFTLSEAVTLDAPRAVETIVLTVKWNGQGNLAHTRTFTMRYAQNGLHDYYILTAPQSPPTP